MLIPPQSIIKKEFHEKGQGAFQLEDAYTTILNNYKRQNESCQIKICVFLCGAFKNGSKRAYEMGRKMSNNKQLT